MIDRVTMNARRPESDEYGRAMLERMNAGHYELTQWGLSHVSPERAGDILDIGCGGGRTIAGLLERTNARVCGIDFSAASVAKTKELNSKAVTSGRAEIIQGSAENLPYKSESFDLVTAFETVYYWSDLTACFKGVLKIMRVGGEFLVCNEDCDMSRIPEVAKALDMTLYTADELADAMKNAGFADVQAYAHENGKWVCAVGRKIVQSA